MGAPSAILNYYFGAVIRTFTVYTEQDCLCAAFIRDVRVAPDVKQLFTR